MYSGCSDSALGIWLLPPPALERRLLSRLEFRDRFDWDFERFRGCLLALPGVVAEFEESPCWSTVVGGDHGGSGGKCKSVRGKIKEKEVAELSGGGGTNTTKNM